MRTYADREHDAWWILSAKHGLVDPDGDPIEPYDETSPVRQSNANERGPNVCSTNSMTPVL